MRKAQAKRNRAKAAVQDVILVIHVRLEHRAKYTGFVVPKGGAKDMPHC